MTGLLYFLFLCSGFSGLIYQVVWVRVFGNVFGNTIYSASIVVAVFMLGLGVGSYLVGAWADRRYAARPESLLRAYGYFELVIALMGLAVSALLPHLGHVSALVSSYSQDAGGWYVLSTTSHLARAAIAVVLLTPITLLMGGTLTLLIRHLVRRDVEMAGWRIAVLYAVNTAGAALGCFLTDFALVPAAGLLRTQMVAVFFNVIAGVGALLLAAPRNRLRQGRVASRPDEPVLVGRSAAADRPGGPPKLHAKAEGAPYGSQIRKPVRGAPSPPPDRRARLYGAPSSSSAVAFTSLALAMSGFAAMGMEILWFRHFTILLGGFRAVFSLLLTVILIGIGAGSLISGFLHRRTARPAQWFMVVQGLFVAFTLLGLATADGTKIDDAVTADPAYRAANGRAVAATPTVESGVARELWFNARPILLEVGVPVLLMGFSFPLANAIIQRAERSVGRRAGVLYLSNTSGAVCGSLAAGFLLLPTFGIQQSATILAIAAGLVAVPLYLAEKGSGVFFMDSSRKRLPTPFLLIPGMALGLWLLLPAGYVITRAQGRVMENERVLALDEGLNEVIAVTEVSGKGRTLLTNGHPMSSTRRLSQRYMRALAHIPLLSIDDPESVLVIGFGVGNTTHAATLHPSIRRVEVVDLSRDILAHAKYFKDVNGDVLNDERVVVYVNDGRLHLNMQPSDPYDLITLEPPPIGYAGVAALYSKEFYALARTRLTPKGYISQWLPTYQVPTATTLAMIRAFVEVFPRAVLISGAEADLLLIGANESGIEIDPARLATALSSAPAVQADLQRLDLGTAREIVGTFVGSAQKLAEATRDTAPVSDDRPIQEYGVRSLLNFGEAVPASVVDLSEVAAWCPTCFVDGKPVPLVEGLDTYLALLDRAYTASPVEVMRARGLAERQARVVAGSAYLGAIVPETADLHNVLGIAFAEKGQLDEAITEFREALRLDPDSAQTHWHLGAALASHGAPEEAIEHLRRSVQLDPGNGQAHNDLAVTLAMLGRLDEAIDHFQRALAVDPQSEEVQRNLAMTLRQRRQLTKHGTR